MCSNVLYITGMYIQQITKGPIDFIVLKLIVKNVQSHVMERLFRINIKNGICVYHLKIVSSSENCDAIFC